MTSDPECCEVIGIFSFAVEAFRSGHPGGFGHLDRHDAVQLLHPPPDEGAEVDGGDVAAAATVVVVDVLQPARLQAVTGWQPAMPQLVLVTQMVSQGQWQTSKKVNYITSFVIR